MAWVYYAQLYKSQFQVGCLAARIKDSSWLNTHIQPRFVGVFQTKSGRYGVKWF